MKYAIASVTAKGQFTVPKAIRETVGIKPGDRVTLCVQDGAIVLKPLGRSIVAETAGSRAKHVRRRR